MVPEGVRSAFQPAPFYQKHLSVAWFPGGRSTNVSDAAMWRRRIVRMLSGRPGF